MGRRGRIHGRFQAAAGSLKGNSHHKDSDAEGDGREGDEQFARSHLSDLLKRLRGRCGSLIGPGLQAATGKVDCGQHVGIEWIFDGSQKIFDVFDPDFARAAGFRHTKIDDLSLMMVAVRKIHRCHR